MKLFQYTILSFLIANGSLPLLQDLGIDSPFLQSLLFLDQATEELCEHTDEGTSKTDLTQPKQHVYKEPKPNDVEQFKGLGAYESSTVVANRLFKEGDSKLIAQEAFINDDLLRSIYFSKSKVDPVI